jgi:DedD protein
VSSQFHNRLVGVTILVTSVVIFLPSIIDGKKASYEDEFVATPIKPQLQEHTLDFIPVVNATENSVDNTVEVITNEPIIENNQWEIKEVAEPVTILSTTEVLAQENVQVEHKVTAVEKIALPSQAWTIQLGAFQNAKNINLLLKKLHKAGFQAHTVPTEVIDGELTRVFVGPDVSKKKLEKLLPQLKRLTKLQGKLLAFNAVNP